MHVIFFYQNIPFYVLFSFKCFQQFFFCLCMIFSPLYFFYVFKGEKCQTSNQDKNWDKILLFYRSYYFIKSHDMIQCTLFFFLKACNLGHSNLHWVTLSSLMTAKACSLLNLWILESNLSRASSPSPLKAFLIDNKDENVHRYGIEIERERESVVNDFMH